MYNVPDFNITVNHLRLAAPYDFSTGTGLAAFSAQLRGFGRFPRPGFQAPVNAGSAVDGMTLLCSAGTDIRDHHCTGNPIDMVEAPAGSGRWYVVYEVDDIAKGFANEYRWAALQKYTNFPVIANMPDWPAPIP